MSGSSSNSSDFLLDELLDESESWSSILESTDEFNINVLYGILGATGFFICLYSVRFWCDKKRGNL